MRRAHRCSARGNNQGGAADAGEHRGRGGAHQRQDVLPVAVVGAHAPVSSLWVAIDSAVGKGTTFTIDLPAVDAPVTAPTEPQAPGAPADAVRSPGATILVVEDEPLVRRGLVRSLASLGYTVVERAGPEEALALTDDELARVDVLLTDVLMPGMTGPRLADVLEGRRPGLRTLLASGFAPEQALESRPGTAFLGKPFSKAELADAIRAVLVADENNEG